MNAARVLSRLFLGCHVIGGMVSHGSPGVEEIGCDRSLSSIVLADRHTLQPFKISTDIAGGEVKERDNSRGKGGGPVRFAPPA